VTPATTAVLKSLAAGDPIRLKTGALPHVKIRIWEFKGIEGGKILLYHKAKNYTLEVDRDEIDWEEYRRTKGFDKRRCPRLSLKVPVKYFLANLKNARAAFALDVSEDGISLDLPEKLGVGQILRVNILHPRGNPIEMTAEAVWINPPPRKGETYRSGMKIVKLSPENKKRLEDLLGGPC
jgi:hypothetical protein